MGFIGSAIFSGKAVHVHREPRRHGRRSAVHPDQSSAPREGRILLSNAAVVRRIVRRTVGLIGFLRIGFALQPPRHAQQGQHQHQPEFD